MTRAAQQEMVSRASGQEELNEKLFSLLCGWVLLAVLGKLLYWLVATVYLIYAFVHSYVLSCLKWLSLQNI